VAGGASRLDSGLAPLVGRSDRGGEGDLRRPPLREQDTGLKTGHYKRAPSGSGPLYKLATKQIPQA